jgi:hypothetical protein
MTSFRLRALNAISRAGAPTASRPWSDSRAIAAGDGPTSTGACAIG